MPLYTFDAFIDRIHCYTYNKNLPREELISNLRELEGFDQTPNFVVDHPERELKPFQRLYSSDSYSHLQFSGWYHFPQKYDTAYFEKEEDAMLFFLATN